ncbi:MAG: alpha/beta hydrolase [Rhizobiaceae bacterium]|nr:alpha/beta hydrolase [Rhizobiaceae bacterium]
MQGDPFRTRDHVADFDAIVADIVSRSAATRAELPMLEDVSYGRGPSETLDLFFPQQRDGPVAVHMFVHGGYWRMFSRSDFSCVAQTVTRAGAIAAIIGYALMPAVRMSTIVDQVRCAKTWLQEHISEYGGDPSRVTVSGHSAGGHLGTFLFHADDPRPVNGALLLGGLYDLKPLQDSFLKPEIGITNDEALAFTPLNHRHHAHTDVTLLVGADETPPFHQQAADFAALLDGQGVRVVNSALRDRNHMSAVRDLGIPGTEAARQLAAMIGRC